MNNELLKIRFTRESGYQENDSEFQTMFELWKQKKHRRWWSWFSSDSDDNDQGRNYGDLTDAGEYNNS